MRHGLCDLTRGFRLFHLLDDHPGQIIGGEHPEHGHARSDADLSQGCSPG